MSLHEGVKIDVRKVRYPVVRDALERLHVTQVDNDLTALVFWWDGYMPPEEFFTVYAHQRVNKIPGMNVLCYKNSFFQVSTRMKIPFPSFYNFFPMTFQLPFQFSEFQREHI
jgi:tubulin polyglutamylase TTLL6/13